MAGEAESDRQWVLKAFVENHPELHRDCAAEFEVGLSTVARWGSGLASPHPRLREQIIRWFCTRTGWVDHAR